MCVEDFIHCRPIEATEIVCVNVGSQGADQRVLLAGLDLGGDTHAPGLDHFCPEFVRVQQHVTELSRDPPRSDEHAAAWRRKDLAKGMEYDLAGILARLWCR